MNALLGGSFSSRITRNIRENKGYTYSPGSGVSLLPTNAVWTFNADVTTTATGPSLTEVFKEIRELQATPPGDEEANGALEAALALQPGDSLIKVRHLDGIVDLRHHETFDTGPDDGFDIGHCVVGSPGVHAHEPGRSRPRSAPWA